jgi:FAD/FMN-containing dehydrogenase
MLRYTEYCLQAVAKTNQDIVTLVRFAEKHKISLIPRTAGTSLAGQTVETVLLWMFQNISLRLSLSIP